MEFSSGDQVGRCELIYKNGSIFVRPIEGNCIFLNGRPISLEVEEDTGMCELFTTDRLGFGIGCQNNENNIVGLIEPNYVLTVANQLENNKTPTNRIISVDVTDNDSASYVSSLEEYFSDHSSVVTDVEEFPVKAVLESDYYLSKILAWLPFPDLKEARLVSKQWRSSSQKYFLPCSTVSLQPSPLITDWEKEFQDYSSNVGIYGHQNFKICYTGHPTDGFVDEDVLLFLRQHALQIRKLDLTIMPGRNDFAFLYDILSERQLLNLQELCLTLVSNELEYTTKYFPSNLSLPSVTKLSINFGFEDNPPPHLLQFSSQFVNSFPNICKLEVGSDDSSGILDKAILQRISDKLELEEDEVFASLDNIKLHWATPQVVDLLIDFPNQLVVIDIHVDRREVDTSRIQSVFDAHSETLRDLVLAIHCDEEGFEIPVGEPQVVVPSCPLLRKLVYTCYLQEKSGNLDISDVDVLNFKKIFLDGPENMKHKFPLLRHIQINVTPQSESLFGQLFPENGVDGQRLQFPQITQFRTVYPNSTTPGTICTTSQVKISPWTRRIATMFPNVWNPELNWSRKAIQQH